MGRFRDETRLTLLFLLLLLAYLAIAWWFLAPQGYYGTTEQPRFADPWLERSETILTGGALYRDVFTTTPPITNYILVPPAVVSGLFDHLNPWSTLSFMVYFSLFNLFTALVILHMPEKRTVGLYAAILFLLNPLTFGNTVLRRQDESIIVFFIAVSLYFLLKSQHMKAAAAIGVSMLVKLSGAIVLPVAFLHTRKWVYLIVPFVIFFLVFAPFLALAGRDAMVWDVTQERREHPFQFRGVSLGALWNSFHDVSQHVPLDVYSIILILGVALAFLFIAWKRFGYLEDISILLAVIFILSPKMHTGYFSILALTLAPLLRTYKLQLSYFALGLIAIVADMYKWPVENISLAFWLMGVTYAITAWIAIRIAREAHSVDPASMISMTPERQVSS